MDYCYEHNSPIIPCGGINICAIVWLESRLMNARLYDAITTHPGDPVTPAEVELIFEDLPRTMLSTNIVNAVLRLGQEIHYAPVQLPHLVDALGKAELVAINYLPVKDNEPGEDDNFIFTFRREVGNSVREHTAMISIQSIIDTIWSAYRDEVAPD